MLTAMIWYAGWLALDDCGHDWVGEQTYVNTTCTSVDHLSMGLRSLTSFGFLGRYV